VRLIPRGHDSSSHFLRSAYSLVLNTAATGALGVAFWIVAARLFPTEAVGRDSVLIVTMMTISTICQVNTTNLFVRFLPEQTRPARLILLGYGVSCALAIVLGVIAMIVLPRLSDDLSGLGLHSGLGWLWMLSLALWGIFCLQDAALTGLRHAPWVPVENTIFGLLKLLCLPVFLVLGATYGIFLAWVLPMVLLLVPVNAIVFGRATRRHVPAEPEGGRQGFRSREVRRFLLLDYTSAAFLQGLYTVLPLLVLALLGSSESAYFWIPFSLITAIDMMSLSIATSMTVEGSFAQAELAALARMAVRRFAFLVLGGAAALSIAAPIVLSLFGPDYAANGTGVLRVLTIGVVCHGVIELFVGVARVRRDGRSLALLGIARCGLALALCGLLGVKFGIMGVALGWAGMSLIVALAVLPSVLRVLGATQEGGAAPVRAVLAGVDSTVGRIWTGSRRGERVALASSLLGLVAVMGLIPAVPAFLLALAFVLTAPGTVALGLIRHLGATPEPAAGLVAGLGLAIAVLLAQSMLWLGSWYTRGWLGLLAITCFALLTARALDRPLWPLRTREVLARLTGRAMSPGPGADAEGNR
jgi:O-antigen/teichoic acid export membrane protein